MSYIIATTLNFTCIFARGHFRRDRKFWGSGWPTSMARKLMPSPRRFPPPWSCDEPSSFPARVTERDVAEARIET
jgi:hypothetical protein